MADLGRLEGLMGGGAGGGGGVGWAGGGTHGLGGQIAAAGRRRRARLSVVKAAEDMMREDGLMVPKQRWRDRLKALWRDVFPKKEPYGHQ